MIIKPGNLYFAPESSGLVILKVEVLYPSKKSIELGDGFDFVEFSTYKLVNGKLEPWESGIGNFIYYRRDVDDFEPYLRS